MTGRPINESLATARFMGDPTYIGATHDTCKTNVRYTSGGGCVHCARAKQAAMRLAAKASVSVPDEVLTETVDNLLTEPQHELRPEPWD